MSYLAYSNYIHNVNRMRGMERIIANGAENYESMRFEGFERRGNNDEVNFKIGRDIEVRVVLNNDNNHNSGIVHLNVPQIGENEARFVSACIGETTPLGKFWYYLGRAIIQEQRNEH